MWFFLGCCVVAVVLAYWLRRIVRAIAGFSSVVEITVNRIAQRNGQPPITTDADAEQWK